MSKNTKIALIIVVIVALCICVCAGGYIALQAGGNFLQESLVDNPEEAQSMAQNILEYDRPAGYQEEGAIDIGFMKMVMIVDASGSGPLIMIAEMPSGMGVNEDQMRQQIEQSMRRSMGNRNFDVQLVDEQVRMIGGTEVNFFYYEGTDSSGTQVKQVVSDLFDGKNGLVMVMLMGNASGWDQAQVDAFLDSIR